MRSGARPQAEWVDGETRVKMQRRKRDRASQDVTSPTRLWPAIGLARETEIDNNTMVFEWDEFLNRLGRQYNRIGTVKAFGSISVTYLMATEVGKMVGEKYGQGFYRNEDAARQTLRKVRTDLHDFMHGSSHLASLSQTHLVAMQRAFAKEHADAEADGAIYLEPYSATLSHEEQETMAHHSFSELTLKVGGMALYGSGKVGLDLSQNEILFEERSAIVGHMKSLGFNTKQHIDPAWKPHATIVRLQDHIAVPSALPTLEHPEALILTAPKVLDDSIRQ